MPLDAYACLVWTTGRGELTAAEWTAGPLPLPIPLVESRGQRLGGVTDREARASYFAERVHGHLYGSSGVGSERRWHHFAEAAVPSADDDVVEAWELLHEADETYTVVAHVQLGPNPARSLATLVRPFGPGRDWLHARLPSGVTNLGTARPQLVSHLTWTDAELPAPVDGREALAPWTAVQQWQWFLASGTSPSDVLPDVDAPDLFDGTVWLSRDWRALVLRDGVAFVALTPRSSAHGGGSFHDLARIYVRSLHVDIVLLGRLQVRAVSGFADSVGRISVEDVSADSIASLEAELLTLRTGVWWDHVTRRGRQANDVLVAFQRQHRLPELYRKIVEDLTDAARYIRAKEAVRAEAARRADEAARQAEEDRQQQLERSVALVSFVLLPLSIVFGGLALWADPSPGLFVAGLALSVVLILVIVTAVPSVRRLLIGRGLRR